MSKQSSTDFNRDLLPITAIIFFCIAVVSQFLGYLNPDNAWLVYVADQVAGGQELHKQVIETNPPLVVYLLLIPAYIADYTGIPDQYCFTTFIFAIALGCMALTFRITQNAWLRISIVYMFIFYAGNNFGQREHLFVMLIFPYIASILEKNTEQKNMFVASILAAVGFAIKPYYVLLWAFIEIFSAYEKRSFTALFNIRNYTIGILIALYLLYLFVIEQSYVQDILPLLLQYYGGFDWDFNHVLKNVIIYLIFFQMPLRVAYVKYPKAITREIVFFSACNVACILIVLIQQKSWSNHFYPAACFGILLNVMLTVEMFKNVKPRWNKIMIIASTFVLTMTMAVAITINMVKATHIKDAKTMQTIETLNDYAEGEYAYPLSFDLPALFPAILYSDAKYASRYGHLWMLPGMYADAKLDSVGEVVYNKPLYRSDDEVMLIADIVADIAHNPPTLIFVANREYNTAAIGDFKFDFVKYLSAQKDFAKIFKNYEKLIEIDDMVIYKYKDQ